MMEKLKQLLFVALLASAFVAYYLLSGQGALVRYSAAVAVALLAMGVGLTTDPGQRAWGFFKEARAEIRRVVWPSRRETMQTTMLVVAGVVVASVLFWAVDWLLSETVKALLDAGS